MDKCLVFLYFFSKQNLLLYHNRQKPIIYWSVIFMTAKAEAMMRRLKQDLLLRLPSTYVLTDGFDSSSPVNPTLIVQQSSAAWTTQSQYAVIRIQPVALVFTDGLGNTQQGFSTHYVDVCVESITPSSAGAISVLSLSIAAPLMQSVAQEAGVTRWYLSNIATTPTVAQMTAGNLLQTDTPDTIWRLNAAQ